MASSVRSGMITSMKNISQHDACLRLVDDAVVSRNVHTIDLSRTAVHAAASIFLAPDRPSTAIETPSVVMGPSFCFRRLLRTQVVCTIDAHRHKYRTIPPR